MFSTSLLHAFPLLTCRAIPTLTTLELDEYIAEILHSTDEKHAAGPNLASAEPTLSERIQIVAIMTPKPGNIDQVRTQTYTRSRLSESSEGND